MASYRRDTSYFATSPFPFSEPLRHAGHSGRRGGPPAGPTAPSDHPDAERDVAKDRSGSLGMEINYITNAAPPSTPSKVRIA